MNKVVSYLEELCAWLQLGKASPKLLENISVYVHSYGMTQKISALASVTVFDAQTLRIEPWDKSVISAIEKWIYDSGTWLVPQNMWEAIFVKLPAMTTERRKDFVKLVSQYGEEAKIWLRTIRHDMIKDIKISLDLKEISENEHDLQIKNIDKQMKEYTDKVDSLTKAKSEEIMKI